MELQETWKEVKSWLNEGVSLIPVRDKAENGRPAKTPYTGWKASQESKIDEGTLFQSMEHYNTTAIAVVTGAVSGNLEIIDIDSKYYAGIDAILFNDIKEMYPDLWTLLRIHKTPSGGYHIIYRIADKEPEGNKKLSSRYATDKEIAESQARGVKNPSKTIAFLETRGEGGYALLPPSLGYTVHQDKKIPTITWEERCSLITICRNYDEVVKIEPAPRPTKAQDNFYSKNPFEDYNERVDPISLMNSQGWKFLRENNKFIWFGRPRDDGNDSAVSASYNKEKGIFFMFTTSTELEGNRGYNASTLLSEFKHNGDRGATYKWLINNGYGEVKRSVEQSIIKQAVMSGRGIPANFSPQAQEQYIHDKEQYKEDHPYGIFWITEEESIKISREDLYNVAYEMGFRNFKGKMVQVAGKFIAPLENNEFFDMLKEYIKEEDYEIYRNICNAYESFMQSAGAFTISRMRTLETDNVIVDTQTECYKFYNDIAIRVTASGIRKMRYEDLEGLVWANKILDRDYPLDETVSSGLYRQFLENSTGYNDNVKNVIGYLTHDFKSSAAGYIVVMTERVLNPKEGGGSGKNIFGDLLRNMVTIKSVPGSMIKFDDSFFSAWNYERILFLPDIPKRIDWTFLKNVATDEIFVNKKFVQQFTVAPEDGPKLLLNTNYSYDDIDGGVRRRVRPIEFSDYYTLKGGVDVVHGKMFPQDFNKEDWADFDRTVLDCIRLNLERNGKLELVELSDTGWEKKFKTSFFESTYDFITQNIDSFVSKGFISNTDFNARYADYCAEVDLQAKFKASSVLMNSALDEYCKRYGIEFDKSARGGALRGRKFSNEVDDCPF